MKDKRNIEKRSKSILQYKPEKMIIQNKKKKTKGGIKLLYIHKTKLRQIKVAQ